MVVVVDEVLTDDGACDGGWGGGTDGTDGDDISPALSPLKNSSRFVDICKQRSLVNVYVPNGSKVQDGFSDSREPILLNIPLSTP